MEPFVDIHIRKPIYGTYISIDGRKIQEATGTNRPLRIRIDGVGECFMTGQEFLEGAKITKEVKRYAGNPMTFVYNHAKINLKPIVKNSDQLSLI